MADMASIEFDVQGSAETPYRVAFSIDGKNLTATCTCRAGGFGAYCKHRLGIPAGFTEAIVSENTEQVAVVVSWLPGTDVHDAVVALDIMEEDFRRAQYELSDDIEWRKKLVAAARKNLGRAL